MLVLHLKINNNEMKIKETREGQSLYIMNLEVAARLAFLKFEDVAFQTKPRNDSEMISTELDLG